MIDLLVKEHPRALGHFSLVGEESPAGIYGVPSGKFDGSNVHGSPIQYYLGRASNIDLDTVKILVQAHPKSLTISHDESEFLPIHTLLSNPNIDSLYDINF